MCIRDRGKPTDHQDFLMINQDRAPGANSREFIDFMEAATAGPLPAILHLFRAHGPGGGFSRLRDLFGMLSKTFNGFAAERFNTVAALCCGPYAVRVRLAPAGNPPPSRRAKDIVADMRERLAVGSLAYDLELQFFVDEATTPIEDPWPGPKPRRPSSRWRVWSCRSRASMLRRPKPRPRASIPGADFWPIARWARSCGRARPPTSKARRAGTPPDQANSQERLSTSLRNSRPARKRARLSRKMSKIASFWPSEWLAVCGEIRTLGMSQSGEAGSSGSRSNTSR